MYRSEKDICKTIIFHIEVKHLHIELNCNVFSLSGNSFFTVFNTVTVHVHNTRRNRLESLIANVHRHIYNTIKE